jgi:hypothetical protein
MASPHTHVATFLVLYGVAFAAYVLAARLVLGARVQDARLTLMVVAVSALAHASVIPARPDLSTDIHRYAWEGRVVLHGGNPFLTPPDDSTLAALRDADYGQVAYQKMPAIYPPLAQGAFALAQLVHTGPFTLKILFSLFNLGTTLVLFRLLRRRGVSETHALLFAWNPLVIVEAGLSGHVDAMAAFFLLLGLALWESGRRVWSGVALGGSALVKYLALASVAWLARRRHYAVAAVVLLVLVAGYIPFWSAGAKLFASLRLYTATWYFNGPPFFMLSSFLGSQDSRGGCCWRRRGALSCRRDARARPDALHVSRRRLCAGCVAHGVSVVSAVDRAVLCDLPQPRLDRLQRARDALVRGVAHYYVDTGAWVLPNWPAHGRVRAVLLFCSC